MMDPTGDRRVVLVSVAVLAATLSGGTAPGHWRWTALDGGWRTPTAQRELRTTAEALHREAERLGIHRFPGSRGVALRRRQESWTFAPEVVAPILEAHGMPPANVGVDAASLRKLIRDPKIDPELRRRIAELGARSLQWYWELEDD